MALFVPESKTRRLLADGGRAWPSLVAPLALLLVWAMTTSSGLIPPFILPSPVSVGRVLVTRFPVMVPHIKATVEATAMGIVFALFSASILAVVMAVVPGLRKALYPLIIVTQTIPLIALAPLFILWFGFGLFPRVLVVGLVCFFPILVSLMEGLSSVDPDQIDLLRAMGANRWDLFRRVQVPASIPNLFSGLRISATYSVMGAVIGEWLGGSEGIGVYMLRSQKAFALDRVFAAIVVVVLFSFLVFGIVVGIQYLATPWMRVEKRSER